MRPEAALPAEPQLATALAALRLMRLPERRRRAHVLGSDDGRTAAALSASFDDVAVGPTLGLVPADLVVCDAPRTGLLRRPSLESFHRAIAALADGGVAVVRIRPTRIPLSRRTLEAAVEAAGGRLVWVGRGLDGGAVVCATRLRFANVVPLRQ